MSENNHTAVELSELICELTRLCSAKEEYFASMFNLSLSEFKMLKLFVNSSSYHVKELCQKLSLTNGRITHIVTSLEDKGFVKRSATAEDRRNVVVTLQPKSRPFISNLNSCYIDLHNKILEKIETSVQDKIFDSLIILIEALKQCETEKEYFSI